MAETTIPLPASPPNRVLLAEIGLIARWIVKAAITLFVIPYLTSFVLVLAESGRDFQSLVLYGARQSLSPVFFGMLAQVIIGFLLGACPGGAG